MMTHNPIGNNIFNHKDSSVITRIGTAYTASTMSENARKAQHIGEVASRDI